MTKTSRESQTRTSYQEGNGQQPRRGKWLLILPLALACAALAYFTLARRRSQYSEE